MNEENLKYVLQKSKIETSRDFTNVLMERIELESQQSIQKTIGVSFKKLLLICGFLIMVIGFSTLLLIGPSIEQLSFDGKNVIASLVIAVFGIGLFYLNNFIRTMELSLKF